MLADAAAEGLRNDVRRWVEANWHLDLTLAEWWRRLAESGWAFPTWPSDWYGREASLDEALVIGQELTRAQVVGPPRGMAQSMGGPVLLTFGTEDQKRRYLPGIVMGQEGWCQFFSEPNAGSDLAGVQTKATHDGDQWVVNGQKVWSSGALQADRGLLLARSDPDVPKHKGLSFFIIEVDQPGIDIRPIRQMNEQEHFNESFFTDALVSDADLIGGANNGWAAAMTTLTNERTTYAGGGVHVGVQAAPGLKGGMLHRRVGDIVDEQAHLAAQVDPFFAAPVQQFIELARTYGRNTDAVIRQRLAHLYAISEIARFTTLRSEASHQVGRPPGPESSVGYVTGVALARLSRDLGLEILGPAGMLNGDSAPLGGVVQQLALTAPCHGIMGGSEQIQKNIIGERILGLAREPRVDRDVPFRQLSARGRP